MSADYYPWARMTPLDRAATWAHQAAYHAETAARHRRHILQELGGQVPDARSLLKVPLKPRGQILLALQEACGDEC